MLLYVILVLRIIQLSVFTQKTYHPPVSYEKVKDYTKRVDILDRNGLIVATNLDLLNFYLNRDLLSDLKKTAKQITELFPDLKEDAIYKKLIDDSKAKLILIRRNITQSQK
jgi:cell division protein FtsI/penicillin-binding protein 2